VDRQYRQLPGLIAQRQHCTLAFTFWFFITALNYKIKIDISDEGLHYTDELSEYFMAFSQIIEIRIKKIAILVTLSDGCVLKIPRVFMLEEFLAEYQDKLSNVNDRRDGYHE